MGTFQFHAIIVTGYDEKDANKHREVAINLIGKELVTPIIPSIANGWFTFFIAPDGSKQGWNTSDEFKASFTQFKNYLESKESNYPRYVEVSYGELGTSISAASDEIMRYYDER